MATDRCPATWDYDAFGSLVCDRPAGHDGAHYDAGLGAGFTWSEDEPAPDDVLKTAE